jgi:hypothetical protein
MDMMEEHAKALGRAIDEALPRWVEQSVERTLVQARGRAEPAVMAQAREAGRQARADVVPRVWRLLESDIDEQRSTPLAIVRQAVRYPTEVLRSAGVAPMERDPHQQRLFPDDVYDLSPATFSDIDAGVAEAGLAWGAAKAYTHLQRHREAGS